MPKVKTDTRLRRSPDQNGDNTIRSLSKGQEVTILNETDPSGKFYKVVASDLPGDNNTGWVKIADVDSVASVPGAIDQKDFAVSCFQQASIFQVNGHYLIAVAQMRSGIKADTDNGNVGPFRLSQAEWDALRSDPTRGNKPFLPEEIVKPGLQCIVFARMAQLATEKLNKNLGRELTATELYLAQLIGPAAAAAAIKSPDTKLKDILDKVTSAELPAGSLSAETLMLRYASLLSTTASGKEAMQKISDALNTALKATCDLIIAAGASILDDADNIASAASGPTQPDAHQGIGTTSDAKVRTACEALWPAYKDDCGHFARAVAKQVGATLDGGNANEMVDALLSSGGVWRPLVDGKAAAQSAGHGMLVIGGLRANEMNETHEPNGHIVVVVSGELEYGKYPKAYCGSISTKSGVRLHGDKSINWTFPSHQDCDKVHYFERET